MTARRPIDWIRPNVKSLRAYVPGEQPKIKGLIKLNTNENPYPPSPKVLAAVKAATDERLRLYPPPTADALREKLAAHHKCQVENLIVGNGADELLALATRAFAEPALTGPYRRRAIAAGTVQYFVPGYSLYPVLADINESRRNPVHLNPDFTLPAFAELKRSRQWDFHAGLSFITTPNAPGGRGYATADLRVICQAQDGVMVLDEAYADFAEENAMKLALELPQVLVVRTFSKAYSLCFQRVGYCVGHPELIEAMHKVRDSYNVNGLGQVAALATLDDLPYYRRNIARVIAARERLSRELVGLGFTVLPSRTNFLFARPPQGSAAEWRVALRARKILVRWFDVPEIQDFLRITIGTEEAMRALVLTARDILRDTSPRPGQHAAS